MSHTLEGTPYADGFRMPAEFDPHRGCWMLWPERGDTWRLGAKPAQSCFTRVAEAIAAFEPVTVGVNHGQWENARACLPDAIRVVEISSSDAWMRDVGPTFVINASGRLRGIDWKFNAWGGLDGGLYFPWLRGQPGGQKNSRRLRASSATAHRWSWRGAPFMWMARGLSSPPKSVC